jgi:hypothetical protein
MRQDTSHLRLEFIGDFLNAQVVSGLQRAAPHRAHFLGVFASHYPRLGQPKVCVRSPSGGEVPLDALAAIAPQTAPLTVNHQVQFPAVTIPFNLRPGMRWDKPSTLSVRLPLKSACHLRSRPDSPYADTSRAGCGAGKGVGSRRCGYNWLAGCNNRHSRHAGPKGYDRKTSLKSDAAASRHAPARRQVVAILCLVPRSRLLLGALAANTGLAGPGWRHAAAV